MSERWPHTLYISKDPVPYNEMVHAQYDLRRIPHVYLQIDQGNATWRMVTIRWDEAVKLAKAILEADSAKM